MPAERITSQCKSCWLAKVLVIIVLINKAVATRNQSIIELTQELDLPFLPWYAKLLQLSATNANHKENLFCNDRTQTLPEFICNSVSQQKFWIPVSISRIVANFVLLLVAKIHSSPGAHAIAVKLLEQLEKDWYLVRVTAMRDPQVYAELICADLCSIFAVQEIHSGEAQALQLINPYSPKGYA